MRLESALFTSREGLNVHGQALGVIGDNISNVNTISYKTSRSEFADLVANGEGSLQNSITSGGGSGVQVANIRQIQDTGVIEFTGRQLDVAIAGRGFFMLGSADDPSYTRAGNFQMDNDGFLVNSQGQAVLGTAAGGSGLSELNLLEVNVSGNATTAVSLTGNLDAGETVKEVVTAPTSFNQIAAGANVINSITVYDTLGTEHAVSLAYFKSDSNSWTVQAYVDGQDVGQEAGTPVLAGETTLTFTENGLVSDTTPLTASIAYSNGAAAGSFTVDLSNFSQYAASSELRGVTQDGTGIGEVTGYAFKDDGKLVAILTSGAEVLVGTVQLADFANLDALIRQGSNIYTAGEGAGAKDPAAAGTNGLGILEGSSLERSTVDLASQFVDLTLYQRGYQANSQVLNAANSLLRDTLGLIR